LVDGRAFSIGSSFLPGHAAKRTGFSSAGSCWLWDRR
jgi:hypothetical protein